MISPSHATCTALAHFRPSALLVFYTREAANVGRLLGKGRLAARVDERQYTKAAGLREDRMMEVCQRALEQSSSAWTVETGVKFSNPKQEADILANRDTDNLILELKSTLRPETPWEVYKRNEELTKGIKQAKALVDRGIAKRGFVITDGYRGDYESWSVALSHSVPIGTLDDLPDLAESPLKAVSALQERVGIAAGHGDKLEQLPDREAELGGWRFRLVDGERQTL